MSDALKAAEQHLAELVANGVAARDKPSALHFGLITTLAAELKQCRTKLDKVMAHPSVSLSTYEAVERERDAALARVSRLRDIDPLASDMLDAMDRLAKQRDEAHEELAVTQIQLDNAAHEAKEFRLAHNRLMELYKKTKMDHGLCEPVERKACTNCAARRELDRLLSEWKGPRVVLA